MNPQNHTGIRSSPWTLADLIPNQTPLDLSVAWVTRPLLEVGPTSCPLTQAPTGTDSAGAVGCRSQLYTSWDCWSRSFVASIYIRGLAGGGARQRRETQRLRGGECGPDTPTETELNSWTSVDRAMFKANKKIFYRGVGLLTAMQLQQTKYIRQISQRCVHEADSDDSSHHRTHTHYLRHLTKRDIGDPVQAALDNKDAKSKKEKKKPTPEPAQKPLSQSSSGENEIPSHSGGPSAEETNPQPAPVPKTAEELEKERIEKERAKMEEKLTDQRKVSGWRSDTVPVRVVTVSTWKSKVESTIPIPYSPMYASLLSRIADPSAVGALGSTLRAPSVRDSVSMLSLVKYLSTTPKSSMEVAAALRVTAMGVAITEDCYSTEIVNYRIIRGWTQSRYLGVEISQLHDSQPQDSKIIAVPLDLFVSVMLDKQPAMADTPIFSYLNADITWTAIPMTSEVMNMRYSVPYVASFLTSQFWNGTVNHVMAGVYTGQERHQVTPSVMRLIPAINSVYIPGPKHIVLVLADYSSFSCPQSIMWQGAEVPVFRGVTIQQENYANFNPIWNRWWSNDNIGNISRDAAAAHKHLGQYLGVENTMLLAASIASEIYTTLYNGMAIRPLYNQPGYDWNAAVLGGWSLYDDQHLSANSRVTLDEWESGNDAASETKARRRLVGYNFSSLTAWHLPSTGCSLTREAASRFQEAGPMVVWATGTPANMKPNYDVTTTESLMRVAIYVRLILTHEVKLFFESAHGMGTFVHMLSGALSAQFGLIFSNTNLDLSLWSGFNTRLDDITSNMIMQQAIERATAGIAKHTMIQQMIADWHNWDEDVIFEYFGMDPFTNLAWLMATPLPHHFIQQWSNKIKYRDGKETDVMTYFYHNGQNRMGLALTPESQSFRGLMYCTVDAERYLPELVYRSQDRQLDHMPAWVDQWSYVSLLGSGSQVSTKQDFLESQELVLTMISNALIYTPNQEGYILNSRYVNKDPNVRVLRLNDIQFPDPIDWGRILEGAKNYVLYPALAALGGFAAGGPAGALIAGGTTLAKQIIDRNVQGPTKEKALEIVDKAKDIAETKFLNPLHTTRTHDSEKTEEQRSAEKQLLQMRDMVPGTEMTTVQQTPNELLGDVVTT
nr:capsid protein [Totiviridae sp.]